jgi:hypothetical protein
MQLNAAVDLRISNFCLNSDSAVKVANVESLHSEDYKMEDQLGGTGCCICCFWLCFPGWCYEKKDCPNYLMGLSIQDVMLQLFDLLCCVVPLFF